MGDSNVRVPPDSTGKKIDATSLDVGVDTVYRQRIVIADNSATSQYATVTGGALLVAGTVAISGTASVSLPANLGTLNDISRTVQVAVGTPFTVNNISATVVTSGLAGLTAGASNIGFINHISATVTVAGNVNVSATHSVILAAGTANFGTLNDISRTVQVAIGTPFTVNNISATVNVAGNLALTGAVAISGTAIVAGVVGLTAGTAVIGDLNAISRTVQVAIGTPFTVNNISATVNVAITSGGGSGFSQVDGTSFDTQTAPFVPIGGVFDDASSNTLSENDAGVVRMTANRAIHVNIRDIAGVGLGTAGAALAVNVHAISATASVILATGTANIGTLNNISATISVVNAAGTANIGAVSLAAGTSNIGFINNISATVTVVGIVNVSATASVILAAGTANFGTLNDISRTVQVAVGTPFTVNNISATVSVVLGAVLDSGGATQVKVGDSANSALRVNVVAGAAGGVSQVDGTTFVAQTSNFVPIGGYFQSATAALSDGDAGVARMTTNRALHVSIRAEAGGALGTAGAALSVNVQGISATASVILAAGAANIGTLNGISATVTIVGNVNISAGAVTLSGTAIMAVAGYTPTIMSASHGPKCVTASTSANITMIASPGAGQFIHITQLMVGNNGSTQTLARIGTSASVATIVQPLAASGGGFVYNFNPPWKLSASEAALCSVKPNVADVYFTVNFFVA